MASPASGEEDAREGRVNINQDERLNDLMQRLIRINEENAERNAVMPGFRIRIFSQSGQAARQNAINEQAKFFASYPDLETYLEWDQPNFKVYIGDFRTRSEALKMQKRISKDYPFSFIVGTRINFPPIE